MAAARAKKAGSSADARGRLFCYQQGGSVNKQALIPKPPREPLALLPSEFRTVSLLALVRGQRPAEARSLIADLKAILEERLLDYPDDYDALVLLGELNLRVGLAPQARELLYRASLQQPPSWEAFQRTSLLLRRAEEQLHKSFDRVGGVAPPVVVRRVAARVADGFTSVGRKLTSARKVGAGS